jgi:hypothetical protein
MKIQNLSLLAAAASACFAHAADDEHRNLANLAQKWNLTEPSFDFQANTFSLTFPVTDYINSGMANYSLWTAPDCQEGNVNIEASSAWKTRTLEESTALAAATTFGEGGSQLDSGEFNGRSATVVAEFDPQTIFSATEIYSESTNAEGQLSAQVQFCIRFGLYTSSDQPGISGDPVEVNFLETIITLTVDLTDGFEINGINVTPKDRLVRTANVAYLVRGYECDEVTKAAIADTSIARNQGEVITVCVTPEDEAKADGIFMRSIDSFVWSRDTDVIVQPAIEGNSPAGNLLTDYSPAACRGTEICTFSTILFADFYFSQGTVDGAGIASLQFGTQGVAAGRKLRANKDADRFLQEDGEPAAAEFDLNLQVNQAVVRGASGAASTMVGMMSMVSMMAAVAML